MLVNFDKTDLTVSKNASRFQNVKVIDTFYLPNNIQIAASGLLVVIGPNSSGKTRLLRELYSIACGSAEPTIVVKDVKYAYADHAAQFVDSAIKLGLCEQAPHGSDVLIRATTSRLGTGESVSSIPMSQLAQDHYLFKTNPKQQKQFLSTVGPWLITGLFLDKRLTWSFTSSHYDYQSTSYNNELQGLFYNKYLGDKFSDLVQTTFGRCVSIDATCGGTIRIRVSDSPLTDAERLDPSKMRAYRTLESEGDGFKSFCAMSMALLLSNRPACVIDEPELCLHPTASRAIGVFIGKNALASHEFVAVATHSSHVLRGILESGSKVTVLRMSRDGSEFQAHILHASKLEALLLPPRMRSVTVLDGLFADRVVIVEGDSDLAVYQAAHETSLPTPSQDIHFIAAQGSESIETIVRVLNSLNLPISCIIDFDQIIQIERIQKLLNAFSIPDEIASTVIAQCKIIAQTKPPNDALRKGISCLPDAVKEIAIDIQNTLASNGIYIAPNDLERWWKCDSDSFPRKAECANLIVSLLHSDETSLPELRNFTACVTARQKFEIRTARQSTAAIADKHHSR
jgi:energy-coupling factor transporter ATP-binding protein EcfA2